MCNAHAVREKIKYFFQCFREENARNNTATKAELEGNDGSGFE